QVLEIAQSNRLHAFASARIEHQDSAVALRHHDGLIQRVQKPIHQPELHRSWVRLVRNLGRDYTAAHAGDPPRSPNGKTFSVVVRWPSSQALSRLSMVKACHLHN